MPNISYFLDSHGGRGYTDLAPDAALNAMRSIDFYGFPQNVIASLCPEDAERVYDSVSGGLRGFITKERAVINHPRYDEGELAAAHECFAEAMNIHDAWERIYIENMDFAAADRAADEFVEKCAFTKGSGARKIERFMGAGTAYGSRDFVPLITDGMKRYLIKGRPGTGKSTFMKKVAAAAADAGFETEIYYCGFDSKSIDMVAVRAMNFCIFDSTAPHEYFPIGRDEVIDLYEIAVRPGTDEKYASELENIKRAYKDAVSEGTRRLLAADEARKRAENDACSQLGMEEFILNAQKLLL